MIGPEFPEEVPTRVPERTLRQFAGLCAVLGAPRLATDERFATNPARVQHRELLRTKLTRLLAVDSAAAWTHKLTDARVPAGTVNDIAGAFALAENLGLDPIVHLPRGDGTSVALCRNPINLSRTPTTYRTAPPELPDAR